MVKFQAQVLALDQKPLKDLKNVQRYNSSDAGNVML